MATHFVLQVFDGLAREIPSAAYITKHAIGDFSAIETFSQNAVQGFTFDFGYCVPQGNLYRSDGDRALAVATRFFSLHHAGHDFLRVEIFTCGV